MKIFLSVFFLSVMSISICPAEKPIVIYHAFDESFTEIIGKLPSLAKTGYSHIQVSPIQKSTWKDNSNDNKWWRAYQPLDYTIEGKYGTENDFKKLLKKANKNKIKIIVDVVFSHIAGIEGVSKNEWIDAVIEKSKGDSIKYNTLISRLINRQNDSEYLKLFPENINPFRINYDHEYQNHAVVNKKTGLSVFLAVPHKFENQPYKIFEEAQNEKNAGFLEPLKTASLYFGLWFDDHPSINLSDANVVAAQKDYLNRLIKLGVKGFRFDALGRFPPSIWKNITGYLKSEAKDVWFYGEHIDESVVGNLLYSRYGTISDFILYKTIKTALSFNESIESLRIPKSNTVADSVTWVETHDTKCGRDNVLEGLHGECIADPTDRKLGLFYILARHDGIPLILNSDHNDHVKDLSIAIAFRKIMTEWDAEMEHIENINGTVNNINLSQNIILLTRGRHGFMVLNKSGIEIIHNFTFTKNMNGVFNQLGTFNEILIQENTVELKIPARSALFFVRK